MVNMNLLRNVRTDVDVVKFFFSSFLLFFFRHLAMSEKEFISDILKMDISYLESLLYVDLVKILLELSYDDIQDLCLTSSYLANVCSDWSFWSQKAEHDFGIPTREFYQTTLEDPRFRYLEFLESPYQRLLFAISRGDRKHVETLLKQYNFSDVDEMLVALQTAIEKQYLDIVEYIVSHGYAPLRSIILSLYFAASQPFLPAVKYLLHYLLEKDELNSCMIYEVIRTALVSKNYSTVFYLIDSELLYPMNIKWLLKYALYYIDVPEDVSRDIVISLINHGVDITSVLDRPIKLARSKPSVLETLLSRGLEHDLISPIDIKRIYANLKSQNVGGPILSIVERILHELPS